LDHSVVLLALMRFSVAYVSLVKDPSLNVHDEMSPGWHFNVTPDGRARHVTWVRYGTCRELAVNVCGRRSRRPILIRPIPPKNATW